jgi:carbonic anhydrase
MFTSKIAEQIFGADNEFVGNQFHFHSGSEHTIDDKRFDLEMHTVHYPKDVESGFIAAAVGIIFSVEDYTANLSWSEQALIDNFFDSLKWSDMSEEGPTVDLVTYGNLMQLVDTNSRYIYKGSVTTPPCATFVYWNVLSTVYPISARHVDLFKK